MTATYKSTAPAFKAAFVTALAARAGLAGVLVSYGAPLPNPPREHVTLGDLSGSQEFAQLGAMKKYETFTLDVYVSVVREGNQQKECTERAFQIAAEIEDELRTNPTMSGTVRVAEVASPFDLEEFASDTARQSVLSLGVQATEKI
jgi:hypothetical protein